MKRRVGIVVFPGSNCEHDVAEALSNLGGEPELVWHRDKSVADYSALVIPGGFAHGDYLRPGAIAKFSPIMEAVIDFANSGKPVLGICNGFQVLTEAGLLPGALQKNSGLQFICKTVELEVTSTNSVLTYQVPLSTRLLIPINHFEGNYTCDDETYERLVRNGQVVLKYVDNPNGSVGSIAGISNEAGNIVGLMPHPERACDAMLGSEDGCLLMNSFLAAA